MYLKLELISLGEQKAETERGERGRRVSKLARYFFLMIVYMLPKSVIFQETFPS